MKYRDIDSNSTPYRGKHKPLYQRLIRNLYKKYVNYPYLPEDCEVRVITGDKFNSHKSLKIIHSTICNEYYFFSKVGEKDKDRIIIV